jgi:hypothetical protein
MEEKLCVWWAGKKSCAWVIGTQQGIRKQDAVDGKPEKERGSGLMNAQKEQSWGLSCGQ